MRDTRPPTVRPCLPPITCFALLALIPTTVMGQVETPTEEERRAAEEAPLFSTHDLLVLTIETDLDRVIDDRDDDREEQPGLIRYQDETGAMVELAVQIEPRGVFRKEKRNCTFPPLRLNVRTRDMVGTLFEGEDKLKLVTPCREGRSTYQGYVFREYLAYRIFNELSPVSFRVRLLDLTYLDSEGERDSIREYAFLIEDEERMAARNDAVMGTLERLDPRGADGEYAQLVALFQFMIGNTDWTPFLFHNVELIRTSDLRYLTVPYDFDFAGLVDARYASPDPELSIRRVRDRLFRGFCLENSLLEPVRDQFNDRRGAIEAAVGSVTLAGESAIDDTLEYLGTFYDVVNQPGRWRRDVVEACRKLRIR